MVPAITHVAQFSSIAQAQNFYNVTLAGWVIIGLTLISAISATAAFLITLRHRYQLRMQLHQLGTRNERVQKWFIDTRLTLDDLINWCANDGYEKGYKEGYEKGIHASHASSEHDDAPSS